MAAGAGPGAGGYLGRATQRGVTAASGCPVTLPGICLYTEHFMDHLDHLAGAAAGLPKVFANAGYAVYDARR